MPHLTSFRDLPHKVLQFDFSLFDPQQEPKAISKLEKQTHINLSNISETMDAKAIGEGNHGFAVFFFILVFIILVTFLFYICPRNQLHGDSQSQVGSTVRTADHDQDALAINVGLDEATLSSFPKLFYSQSKVHESESTASCCSICLGSYRDNDMLRMLPDCGHLFHLKCVDTWLRLHPSCPICRSSPALSSPQVTPPVEVAPLATPHD
ncbi:hypothetical protein Nepgr_009714 [Nepenthes gracilis]|uniref:RING-type domain-containing protein n=1 Tax=Nepenthes gracilis TaxID=150966 RepID=A0AAD3XKL6_NEPGR|nr:hypothetical protein Nepgr_009714 [Nepenthes gracilis]